MDPVERPSHLSGIVRGGASSAKAMSFDDMGGGGFDLVALPSSRGGDPKQAKILALETQLAGLQTELRQQRTKFDHELTVSRDEAYQQGLRDGTSAGETSGRAIAQAQADRKLGEIESSVRMRLETVERALDQVFLDWESRIMELAMAISRRIVGQACEAPGEAAMHVARMALRKLGSEARVMVRCHPKDLTTLEHEKELWGGRGGVRKVVLEPDESVGRGGIVIETDTGTIDARIPRLTENVERALAQALEEERPVGRLSP
jgi:flagellar biosynthesis/type III secretory pathway protein FliH